ncbi:MAG: Deoxycytidylate deaminase [uncultured bacterium (gcode 4)]|uniref:Deoxycytidylate deaminase n=1 Tax=uncultured bacterium (gcode 4) TaxID=1234023 RepID=K2F6U4_9BACT|nr:MAG: Deoxycytidylate deaminase [uncultured bacterium (gcode 4)]
MEFKNLYIGWGFDILHDDHKFFINEWIRVFSEKYWKLEKIIIWLKSDERLYKQKWYNRPFFSLDWRIYDMSVFLKTKNIDYEIIKTSEVYLDTFDKCNTLLQVRADNKDVWELLKNDWFNVFYVNPFDNHHTSNIEKTLFEVKNMSNCNLRKVWAILIRDWIIIKTWFSWEWNCNNCKKFIKYKQWRWLLSKSVPCDYKHAEEICLERAITWDDLIISDSPCIDCAMLIEKAKIKRVVYLNEYHDTEPVKYLKSKGILVKKAWLNNNIF